MVRRQKCDIAQLGTVHAMGRSDEATDTRDRKWSGVECERSKRRRDGARMGECRIIAGNL